LGKWLISVRYNLKQIQRHLLIADQQPIDLYGMMQLSPTDKTHLQVAEYDRVELLGYLTEMSRELHMPDPHFRNTRAQLVPGAQTH
jgi:hypothetical protein